MAAEAARVLNYPGSRYYGTAAPARAPYIRPVARPVEIPAPQERIRTGARTKEASAQSAPSVSLFAIFGALLAGVLMVFVMLAQISYNEIAGEAVRLNTQLAALSEQERRLEIQFESVIDMKEIERYARDTLGMSKPDADQVAIVRSMPIDNAEIIANNDEDGLMSDFGSFISSLFKYFRQS